MNYQALPPAPQPQMETTKAVLRTAVAESSATVPPLDLSKVTVAWSPPQDLNGQYITNGLIDYMLMWGTNTGTYSQSATVPWNTSVYSVTNLVPGTVFYFSMIAQYSNGANSGQSQEIFTPVNSTNLSAPPTLVFDGSSTVVIQETVDLVHWTNYTVPAPEKAQEFFRVQWSKQ